MATREDLIEYAIIHCCDLVPYDDLEYEQKVLQMTESYADVELDPIFQQYINDLCRLHDDMLERGEIDF